MPLAGIGADLKHGSDGQIIISAIHANGTAASSGMLKVGDAIVKVDKTKIIATGPGEVEDMLNGDPGTTVRVTYKRDGLEMTTTLTRETGDEHQLSGDHGGWKKQDLSGLKEQEAEARRRVDNIYSGQEAINKNEPKKKDEGKMSASELAAYQARRKAEDDANIKAADELVAKYEARDKEEAEAAEKEKGKKKDGGMFGGMFGGSDHKSSNNSKDSHGGIFGFMGGDKKEEKKESKDSHGGIFGFMGGDKKEEKKESKDSHGGIFGFMGGDKKEEKVGGKEENGGLFGMFGHKEDTHKQAHGWFSGMKQDVKNDAKKEWWDVFPERNETSKKKAKRELMKAAVSYQYHKVEDKISSAINKDNDEHHGLFGGKKKKKQVSGDGLLPWENNKPSDDKWLNNDLKTPVDGLFDLCSVDDRKAGKGGKMK